MWFGPNLQRSYKYMMFASKMPSLRMDQSDLKCKNGCDYYGNPQWQGYCSKCHRELMQKQRRAEKATLTSATLPKPEQRKPKPGPGLMPSSSFSRFEAKKQKQSESLKKTNLMKFGSVFGKRTSDDHEIQTEKRSKFKIPTQVFEGMKADFRIRFSRLNPQIDRDARAFVHKFIGDVIEKSNELTVDELSERVQTLYQKFMKYMDTTPYFANVDSDTKERLMDFVEKHAMTYLHELPSVVFSPAGTEDERLDRAMSERIQQLGWVCEARLDCRIDRASPRCRQLLYKAATELLGMDSALSPGGKLSRARRGCRLLLALAPPPASADDLLPALIFTVLKANPPRLVSNINFVTRFCNAQRLMTGEGGYYFTNLCCAVSFIENLNAESLNMDKKEFDCYMAMPASIGGSAWAVALSLCGAAREAEEQTELIQKLMTEADQLNERAEQFAANALSFEEQIKNKVQDVLSKTPLEIKPRRELPRVGKLRQISTAPLIDLGSSVESPAPPADRQTRVAEPPKIQQESPDTSEEKEPKLNILGFEVIERDSPSKSPQNVDPTWDLKQTNSLELLTPSPLGFTPFDSRSIDELMTPDDFVSDHLAPGLSNINYDIDLSDLSAENSLAEDTPKKSKDPFSQDGLKKTFDPFAPQTSKDYKVLEKFDEFSFVDSKSRPSDPFEVVHRDPFSPVDLNTQNDPFTPQINQTKVAQNDPFTPLRNETKTVNDPFAPQINQSQVQNDPFSPQRNENVIQNDMFTPQRSETQVNEIDPFSPRNESSILDDSESPTAACLLPSPLQPQNSGKSA